MRLIFKDIGMSSHFKCGAAEGIALGAGALASGIISGASSNHQIHAQQAENEINRAWQTAEAEKARQYNTSEREAAQGFVQQMNEYNSPVNAAARIRAAGQNPNLVMAGQGANISASPTAQQSSPMPSGVAGLSPVGSQPIDLQIPQLLNGIGGFMKNIGEAEKLGIETDYAKASFDLNLRKLTADASSQEFYSAGLKLENAIKAATKDAAIEKAFEDCKKAHWDAILSEKQGLSEDVRKRVLDSQEALNKAVADYNGKNADLIKLDIEHYEQAFNMRMKIGRSEVASNYGSAAASTASAEQTKLFNKIYSDKRYQHSLVTQAVEAGRQAVSQSKISKSQAEHMNYLVEQAAYANDMKEFTYWSGQVTNFVGTLGQAASQFYGAGALRELMKIRQGQGQPSLESGKGYYMQDGLLFKRP